MRFAACNDPARRAPTPPEPTAAPAIIIPVIPQAEWNFSQAKRWSVRAKLLPPTKGGEIWVVGPTYNRRDTGSAARGIQAGGAPCFPLQRADRPRMVVEGRLKAVA